MGCDLVIPMALAPKCFLVQNKVLTDFCYMKKVCFNSLHPSLSFQAQGLHFPAATAGPAQTLGEEQQ